LILENRDGRQTPVGIHIATMTENSAKGSLPLGSFSIPSERTDKNVYATPLLSTQKRAQLAKSTAYSFLSYIGLSNKKNSKGVSRLANSTGVAVYARSYDENGEALRALIETDATPWERRIQLLNLALDWQVGNPLVLYGSNILTDEMWRLLGERLRGSDPLLSVCDVAMRNSVLRAPK